MLNHTLFKRSLAIGLTVGAAGLPAAAQARLDLNPPTPASNAPAQPVSVASVQQPGSGQSGFQWGDAGIGAAGTIALLGAGAAASVGVRRRRTHRALTS